MDHGFLFNVFVFLAAACVIVPIIGRFKLGSVLGYLLAGVAIGPFGLGLIHNPGEVMHFAEFGVVMMLFLIGLELEPQTLWRLRKAILGLGGFQVVLTSVAFTLFGLHWGYALPTSLACAMALSLSSTALVLQMMQEKGLMQTSAGESSFAVLLFQDIAVIPILILLPLLGGAAGTESAPPTLLSGLPASLRALVIAGVVLGIVVGGRYLSRYLFRFIAQTNLREVFTATSLALIVGTTLAMQAIGVSPALGAFIAGVVLANSDYRHTLESDIEPFKGLLLGLFFISVGMGMDFALFAQRPRDLLTLLVALIGVKAAILAVLGRCFSLRNGQDWLFALALAQGGEFAFVLFQYAQGLGLLDAGDASLLTLAVALSMAATPFVMMVNERFVLPRFLSLLPARDYDAIAENNPVIIAGYGRFGQVVGRFLQSQGVKVTVLEKDADQVEMLRKFGAQGYFGDASRLDLLRNAGAAKAKLLVVAVDDADKCLEIVRLAKRHYPHLAVLARARNRRHAYELHKAGADYFRREMFDASLRMGRQAMQMLGADPKRMARQANRFLRHDEKTLRRSFAFFESEPELISFSRQASGELERILRDDDRETPSTVSAGTESDS